MKAIRILALFLLSAITMTAQTHKELTLDQLMWGGTGYWQLQPEYLRTAFWGDRLARLEVESVSLIADEKGRALAKPQPLFTAADVRAVLPDGGKGLNLLYASFPDGSKSQVLLVCGKQRFLYDWTKREILWSAERALDAQNSEFCAKSLSEAFTKDWNLYLRTADGQLHQVSHDGSRQVPYGTSVHRDEFGITKGTFFSPTGKLLAFYRMDQSMVADYPLVTIYQDTIAAPAPEKYPMAGQTSHKVTVGIFNPQTERTVWLDAGDPTDRYFSNISWAPDEKTIYMIELPRTQDKAELVSYDVETGRRIGVLYTERNTKYVHPVNPITFLPWDETKFIYQSERDGYNHLYLFDTKQGELRQLTKGDFVVLELCGFNKKEKSVIIRSTECSPVRNNLFAVNIETGKRTLLDDGEGIHYATLSSSGALFVDNSSKPSTFRTVSLRATAKKSSPVVLQDVKNQWGDRYEAPTIENGTLKAADGTTDLYYRLVKPFDFDPTKKYPTVVYVYGGPGIRNVEEGWLWRARPWELYMAQKGYVVFVMDNRGSSDRGFAFESATFRHLGDEEMRDQLCGVNYLRTLPYVDADRLGVHGWSFGGFMTTSLMCTYPDVFKVGVAGGPVIDWKFYEVMYGERYMSTPQENPEGYEETSLLNKAKNLKGRLQIIIGYNDPVCLPQHTLSFMRACINAGTQPDLFMYPNQEHNMDGHDRVHLHDRITRFFDDYLK